MNAADTLLEWADRVLQLAIPPVANRIAYVSTPDYTDNAFYVFRHAVRTRNGLEHVWLIRDLSLRPRIERDFDEAVRGSGTNGNTLRVEARASIRGYWHFLRSRLVFHTHAAYRFRTWAWRRQVVCLWHGMPIKCVGRLNRLTPNTHPTFGTLHLATSSFFREIIATAFGVAIDAVKVCSLPRCDALQYPDAVQTPRERVRERLGIDPGLRLVLWMPTYRAEGAAAGRPRSFLDDLPAGTLEALDQAAASTGCVVLAKLHPQDALNLNAPCWNLRQVRLLLAPDWTACDIQLYDLIAASDALISDVSSVLIDYLVTGRPIGILGFDAATYTRELTFPIEQMLATGRFDVLDVPATFEVFLRRRDTAPGHTFLYDAFERPGAEQILGELGV